jgi:hypothetical protein
MGNETGHPRNLAPPAMAGASPAQIRSSSKRFDWPTVAGQEVQAAQIFFATDQSALTRDDERALRDLARSLTSVLLQPGWDIYLKCEGWADPRHNQNYNLALSQKRCDNVIAFIQHELDGGARGATYSISGAGHGERGGPDPRRYAEERCVDVFVKVTKKPVSAPAAPAAPRKLPGLTQWARRRANLFRKYSPSYHLWLRLGLDYLIDEYEQNEELDLPVHTIRPADIPKVMALIEQLASPHDVARIKEWARSGMTARVLAETYCVEYRRAYDTAYRRSPGTLIK